MEKAGLLSRYITESNHVNKIHYKLNRLIHFNVFKSILKTLFNNYRLISDKEFFFVMKEIREKLLGKKRLIIETFLKIFKIKNDFVEIELVFKNFKRNELFFSKKEIDFFMIFLFKKNKSIERIDYKTIFESAE